MTERMCVLPTFLLFRRQQLQRTLPRSWRACLQNSLRIDQGREVVHSARRRSLHSLNPAAYCRSAVSRRWLGRSDWSARSCWHRVAWRFCEDEGWAAIC